MERDNMKNYSLIVIGRLSYPSPSAPTNRVHLYCKALQSVSGFSFVINLHSTSTDRETYGYMGRYEGIPFFFAQKTRNRLKNLFLRNLNKITGIINAFIVIRRISRNRHTKVLFFNSVFWEEFIFWVPLKVLKIKTIREINEAPSFIIKNKKHRAFHNFILNCRLKFFDDIIVISDYLHKFYSKKFSRKHIYQIPILVDMERFTRKPCPVVNKDKIITYVGFMGGNKDGLLNLIDSMVIVKDHIPNFKLVLVGSAPEIEFSKLKDRVTELGLQYRIDFVGQQPLDKIADFLCKADLLVLARPNNNQAKAGFPTKLGEYLASAKPVVITKTGEISKYLKNCQSAYLTEPDNVNDFAKKIIFALNDKNSVQIGKNGFHVANENFNFKLYGQNMIEIIKN